MNDFSFIEKLDILMKLISSSSLFLMFSVIGVFLLIFLIVCVILNKKVNKTIFIIIFSFIGLLILINYGTIIVNILDSIIDSVFKALYFPDLPIYAGALLISNVYFVIVMFNKKGTKSRKIVNLICTIILDFLFILIINLVSKNNINIYDEINLYTNSTLLVLLELSMGIFVSSILLNLILSAHEKLKKYDKKEYPKMQEIIFD